METRTYLLKIDPYTEEVYEIAFSEKYSDLVRWTGGRSIMMAGKQDNDDTALLNAESLRQRPYAPAWHLEDSTELYFGTGLWVNLSEEGELRTPLFSAREMRNRIHFMGFVEPHIEVELLALDNSEISPGADNEDSYGEDEDDDKEF